MRQRKQALGTRNLIGARVEATRKNLGMKQKELLLLLRINGIDMNAPGLSKLEGQHRYVADFELAALAKVLDVSVDWLLGRTNYIKEKQEMQKNKKEAAPGVTSTQNGKSEMRQHFHKILPRDRRKVKGGAAL